MKRRNFFKNMGAVIIGAVLAPVVAVKAIENTLKTKRSGFINVDWKGVSPSQTITTVGSSTGGKNAGDEIFIKVNNGCRIRLGCTIYYIDDNKKMIVLIVVGMKSKYKKGVWHEDALSSIDTIELTLKTYDFILKIGKGGIKDDTKIMIGDEYTTYTPCKMFGKYNL